MMKIGGRGGEDKMVVVLLSTTNATIEGDDGNG